MEVRMSVDCPQGHGPLKLVKAGISKRTNKPFKAFMACSNYGCKETAPATDFLEETPEVAVNKEPQEEVDSETKKFEDEMEDDYKSRIDRDDAKDAEPKPEVEDKPMTRLDWNAKEFIKGLGVFSSAARSEGMGPKAAFEEMSIWEWMDLAYGDLSGYAGWKEKAKRRIK